MMDNKLQVFRNEMFEVAIQLENGEVLFEIETVAKSLGFTQKKGNKLYVRWETINKYLKKYVSQDVGKGDFIPEPLVYKLAFKANNKIAESFQDWLAIEVLPSIRKHGAYLTDEKIEEVLTDPDTIIKLATQLKAEREEKKLLQQQAEEDKPKVLFAEAVTASHTTILVGELAKLLRQNGIDTGQNRLFSWLRNNGYLIKRKGTDYNMPTQKAMDLGLFEVKETSITHSDGHISVSKTPKVTGKGQLYFINKFKEMDLEKVM